MSPTASANKLSRDPLPRSGWKFWFAVGCLLLALGNQSLWCYAEDAGLTGCAHVHDACGTPGPSSASDPQPEPGDGCQTCLLHHASLALTVEVIPCLGAAAPARSPRSVAVLAPESPVHEIDVPPIILS